jgi:hypothetical protein
MVAVLTQMCLERENRHDDLTFLGPWVNDRDSEVDTRAKAKLLAARTSVCAADNAASHHCGPRFLGSSLARLPTSRPDTLLSQRSCHITPTLMLDAVILQRMVAFAVLQPGVFRCRLRPGGTVRVAPHVTYNTKDAARWVALVGT